MLGLERKGLHHRERDGQALSCRGPAVILGGGCGGSSNFSRWSSLRVRQFFADLDRRLGANEYIAGDHFTVADITAFVSVVFARAVKEAVPEEAVNLRRWREAVASRPSARV